VFLQFSPAMLLCVILFYCGFHIALCEGCYDAAELQVDS